MTDENRRTNADSELRFATDALRVAEAALALGIVRDAMSRIYYAAFHAARALLQLEGLEPKTHAGLAHLFSERIVRGGKLEPRYNLLLVRLQSYRLASDYAYDFEMAVDDVRAELAAARDLVERARGLIGA